MEFWPLELPIKILFHHTLKIFQPKRQILDILPILLKGLKTEMVILKKRKEEKNSLKKKPMIILHKK